MHGFADATLRNHHSKAFVLYRLSHPDVNDMSSRQSHMSVLVMSSTHEVAVGAIWRTLDIAYPKIAATMQPRTFSGIGHTSADTKSHRVDAS